MHQKKVTPKNGFKKIGFIGTSLFRCNFSEIYIQIWISIQFWILKPILTYFSRKKITLGRKFYSFLVWKYELCLSKLKITENMFSTFGLRILLPVQKCMNEMDFEKKRSELLHPTQKWPVTCRWPLPSNAIYNHTDFSIFLWRRHYAFPSKIC